MINNSLKKLREVGKIVVGINEMILNLAKEMKMNEK